MDCTATLTRGANMSGSGPTSGRGKMPCLSTRGKGEVLHRTFITRVMHHQLWADCNMNCMNINESKAAADGDLSERRITRQSILQCQAEAGAGSTFDFN
eukprot:1143140-Pelagomonas_calceolata.AAC.1